MSIINHLNRKRDVKECPKCKKEFYVTMTPQILGFKNKEDLTCPYCYEILRTSMSWDFWTEKKEDVK